MSIVLARHPALHAVRMTSLHASIDLNSCCLKTIRSTTGIHVSACSISQAMFRTTGELHHLNSSWAKMMLGTMRRGKCNTLGTVPFPSRLLHLCRAFDKTHGFPHARE